MKLTAKQITEFMAAPAQYAGVLLYGADNGQMTQRSKQLAAAILPPMDAGFNLTELTEDQCLADEARLADELNAMSLMGGRRLIMVRDASDKLTPILKSALAQCSPSVPAHEQHFLIVLAAEITARSTLRALFEQSKILAALPCYKDEAQGISQLVRTRFNAAGLRFAPESVSFLARQLRGDRMIAESELDKIVLYYGEGAQVDMESLRRLTSASMDIEMGDVCHAFAAAQLAALMRQLDNTLQSGIQPIIVLRSIGQLLSRIEQVLLAAQESGSIDRAIESMRPPLFYKEKPLFHEYAQRWSLPQLRSAKHQLMVLEVSIKQHHEIDGLLLKDSLLRLCSGSLKAAA